MEKSTSKVGADHVQAVVEVIVAVLIEEDSVRSDCPVRPAPFLQERKGLTEFAEEEKRCCFFERALFINLFFKCGAHPL